MTKKLSGALICSGYFFYLSYVPAMNEIYGYILYCVRDVKTVRQCPYINPAVNSAGKGGCYENSQFNFPDVVRISYYDGKNVG